MWGVQAGPTDVFEGDFTKHSDKLHSIISNADVVLANNFVFAPEREWTLFPCILYVIDSQFQSTRT
jgi:hypothetical protein